MFPIVEFLLGKYELFKKYVTQKFISDIVNKMTFTYIAEKKKKGTCLSNCKVISPTLFLVYCKIFQFIRCYIRVIHPFLTTVLLFIS